MYAGMLTGFILCESYTGIHSSCEFIGVRVLLYPETLSHSTPLHPLTVRICPCPSSATFSAPWAEGVIQMLLLDLSTVQLSLTSCRSLY